MNIPGRMCFSVPDLQASVCMIETGEAVNLYPPPGRGIFVHGVNKFKFQAPFVSDAQLAEIVGNAIQGKTSTKLAAAMELTFDEIVRWALTENNGFLQAQQVFREFSSRMEWHDLVKMLADMDDKIFTFNDMQYRVIPGAGQRARQLEQVQDPIS
jgi:hypothetical protein